VLYYILQNRLYLGEIVHRGIRHAGDHEPIISEDLFDAVQERLGSNRRARRERPTRAATCPLAGLVFDADGTVMVPSFSYGRKGRQYRYYVSTSALPGRNNAPTNPDAVRRVSAAGLERLVRERVTHLHAASEPLAWENLTTIVRRVELYGRSIQLVCAASLLAEPHEQAGALLDRLQKRVPNDRIIAVEEGTIRLICDRQPRFRGGEQACDRSVQNSADAPGLLVMLRTAHRLLEEHSMSPMNEKSHSSALAPQWQRQRRSMTLGLLAPVLQKRIINGTNSAPASEHILQTDLPLAWRDQVDLFAGL
jgi:hypothetical protein